MPPSLLIPGVKMLEKTQQFLFWFPFIYLFSEPSLHTGMPTQPRHCYCYCCELRANNNVSIAGVYSTQSLVLYLVCCITENACRCWRHRDSQQIRGEFGQMEWSKCWDTFSVCWRHGNNEIQIKQNTEINFLYILFPHNNKKDYFHITKQSLHETI